MSVHWSVYCTVINSKIYFSFKMYVQECEAFSSKDNTSENIRKKNADSYSFMQILEKQYSIKITNSMDFYLIRTVLKQDACM